MKLDIYADVMQTYCDNILISTTQNFDTMESKYGNIKRHLQITQQYYLQQLCLLVFTYVYNSQPLYLGDFCLI